MNRSEAYRVGAASPAAPRRAGPSVPARAQMPVIFLAAWTLGAGAGSLRAQVSPEILQALGRGGGWVSLAILDGAGSFQSPPVPTLGIRLRGHLRIWEEHTGSWRVVMRDLARDEDTIILEREMAPGERVDFDYQTGMLGQLQLEVRWSEARDTTLRVWVGTEPTPGEEVDRETRETGADPLAGSRPHPIRRLRCLP